MRFSPLTLAALLALTALPRAFAAGPGILDLTTFANYANQPVPAFVNKSNVPAANPITDRGATLGRILFYDKRLSRDHTISCGSCHQQARAFGDGGVASTGVAGSTGRHSMRLVNARFGAPNGAPGTGFFWDERAATLEVQASQPIQNHVEMGFSGTLGDPAFGALVTRLSALDDYRVLFIAVFGDATITEARVQQALAQFVRSIQSFDSRFDAGRALTAINNPFPNFTASENNGKALFLAPPNQGGAGCAGCHRPPEFDIDPASRNNGVITQLGGGTDLTNTRSPSLRDLLGPGGVSNGPFMHDGSHTSLAQVIAHYNVIPGDNANLDGRLRRPGGQVQNLGLNPQARADLVAFLGTLTGSALYTDPKWSDPFDANGQLNLIVLPAAAVNLVYHGDGTATVSTQGVPGVAYQVRTSTDLVTWSDTGTAIADASGLVSKVVSAAGGTFYRIAYVPAASSPAAPPPPAATLLAATSAVTTTSTIVNVASLSSSTAGQLTKASTTKRPVRRPVKPLTPKR